MRAIYQRYFEVILTHFRALLSYIRFYSVFTSSEGPSYPGQPSSYDTYSTLSEKQRSATGGALCLPGSLYSFRWGSIFLITARSQMKLIIFYHTVTVHAKQRINFPHFPDAFMLHQMRDALRFKRANVDNPIFLWLICLHFIQFQFPTITPHPVGVSAVVPHQLKRHVRNMLSYCGNELQRIVHLKV